MNEFLKNVVMATVGLGLLVMLFTIVGSVGIAFAAIFEANVPWFLCPVGLFFAVFLTALLITILD